MKTPLLATLCVLVLALPALAEPEGVVIPIPGWTPEAASPPVFGLPEVQFRSPQVAGPEIPSADVSPSSETGAGLVELLAEEIRAAGGEIEEDDGGLVVIGSEAAVALARSRVAAIERFLTGRSKLAFQLVELPKPDAGPTPDAAAIARRIRSGARLLWTGRLALRRGEGGLREEWTETSFLGAHGTEVAQHASISRVTTMILGTGRRVYVSCRPVSSERAVVTLSVGLSRAPEKMRVVETATGAVDLPTVPFLSLTTSLRLKVGKQNVTLVDSPFGDGLIAMVVTLLEVPSTSDLPFALVDLAALVGHPDAIQATAAPASGILEYADERRAGYDDTYGPGTGHRRTGVIEDLVDALEEMDVQVVQLSPSVVAIAGSEADRAKALEFLAHFDRQGRVARTAWQMPWEDLGRAPFFDPITGAIEADALARASEDAHGPEFAGTLAVSTSGGTPLLLVQGVWRRFLLGMDVEIAEGAAIVRPVVGTYVDGESIIVRPHESAAWTRPWVTRKASTLLASDARHLEVRRDIMGKRTDERGHWMDVIRTADTSTSFALDTAPLTDLHRAGNTAVIHLWTR